MVGSITDDNLDSYTIEISRYGTQQWTTLAEVATDSITGTLATIDTTLLETDAYTLRITARDVNGLSATVERSIELSGQAQIGNFRQEFVDLQLPLAGVPITITRVYDSLKSDVSSDFGFGWSLGAGYDPQIREAAPFNPGENILGMFAATGFKKGTRVYITYSRWATGWLYF